MSRHAYTWVAVVAMGLAGVSPTHAGELNDGLDQFGYVFETEVTGATCAVEMRLTTHKLIENIGQAQKAGLLNPELTVAKINTAPTAIAVVFAGEALPTVARLTFAKHPEVTQCSFKQYLIGTDDYGHDTKDVLVTFDFNRTIYDRINWDNFDLLKFPKIAPHYHENSAIMAIAAQENSEN